MKNLELKIAIHHVLVALLDFHRFLLAYNFQLLPGYFVHKNMWNAIKCSMQHFALDYFDLNRLGKFSENIYKIQNNPLQIIEWFHSRVSEKKNVRE